MMRPVDKALFLAGESTLTAAEVAQWASDLGYPLMADATPVEPGQQLRVATADAKGWRDA